MGSTRVFAARPTRRRIAGQTCEILFRGDELGAGALRQRDESLGVRPREGVVVGERHALDELTPEPLEQLIKALRIGDTGEGDQRLR